MRIRFLNMLVLSILEIQSTLPAKSQQPRQDHAAMWGAMFQSQVNRCWKKYSSDAKIQAAEIIFRIKLKRDGTLESPPISMGKPASSDIRVYQDNAARAIVECQPYKLPAQYYDEWKYFAPAFKKVPRLQDLGSEAVKQR